ncbi:MAG: VLRF1 family aeRF1-type release factor [Anaerolineae bacterium]
MLNLQDVRDLLEQVKEPALSLYLNIDPAVAENQATTPAWRIWLKNALRNKANELSDLEAFSWKQMVARLEAYLNQYRPTSKGVALFITADELRDYEVPLSLENRIEVGAPFVTPLLWLLDEYEPYVIALIDQEQAHFFTAFLGQVGQQDQLELDIADYDWGEKTLSRIRTSGAGGIASQGSNRDAFEAMLDEHRARYYREVAAHIEELCQRHEARRIILGGSEASAHAVQRLMPEQVANKVIAMLPVPLKLSPTEILARVLPRALEYERQQEQELVNEVINLAKSEGRGALGKNSVLAALEQQRVEMLIVPYPVENEALAAELPLKALASSSVIELVHGEAADRLNEEGGLAARLYYAV